MTSRGDSEEPLKAIVFADACGGDERLNLAEGKTLLNTPILTWQLIALARYGVKEAIVLSSEPIPKIEQDPLKRMKVTPLSSTSWTGEGDALRDVESRDDLRPVDDFILVRHGTVFNVDVSRLVAEHKQRRNIDRNWLITTAFRKGTGSSGAGLVVAVDSATGTLVKYVEKVPETGFNIDVKAENAGLIQGGSMEICSDVMDIGLDVCAVDFMTEFRENFYYDKVRSYIKEKLEGGEAEVFGNRMYAHFLKSAEGEYGSRITSLATLSQTSSDALNGWMSPLSESITLASVRYGNAYEYNKEYMVEQCSIGYNVDIGVGSTIVDSVIGSYVSIGSDTVIAHSIIMNNVAIADRTEIERSIIDTRCVIREDSLIPRHCYIDREVYLGLGCRGLPEHSMVTNKDMKEFNAIGSDEESDGSGSLESENSDRSGGQISAQAQSTSAEANLETEIYPALGVGGKGNVVDLSITHKLDCLFVPKALRSNVYEEDLQDEIEEEDSSVEGEDEATTGVKSANGEVDAIAHNLEEVGLENTGKDDHDDRVVKFNEEVFETMERAFSENVESDNTALEINSLKLVYHCSFSETLTGVVAGIAKAAQMTSNAATLYRAVHAGIENYQSIISKFNKEDETHQLQVAAKLANALSPDGDLLSYVFKIMYELDIIEESAILAWAASVRTETAQGTSGSSMAEHQRVKELLEWLEDTDDEDEDEED